MTMTPWGDAEALRERMLHPGPGTPPEEVARNQRERLFAAMVACCAERGYEATAVADVLALSGVSRSAFYAHFANKSECFLAMLDEVIALCTAIVERRSAEDEDGEVRALAGLEAFAELVVSQPAAARACMVEAYAAGPAARERVDRAIDGFEGLIAGVLEGMEGKAGMPAQLIRGMGGALYKVFHTRVYRGDVEELCTLMPRLLELALEYEPPPQPLEPGKKAPSLPPTPPPFALHDPAERILRALAGAVAERGYPKTRIADVAARARVSQGTFYDHFQSKEEATIAALDSSGAQMLAATMPAIRRAPDWPGAVRSAYSSMCGFMAAEPDFARLRAVEVYAAGPAALAMRDRAGMELLEALVAAAPEKRVTEADPIVLEAIGGAVYALIYDCVRDSGPQALPTVVPPATYITLAPFIGAERACEVANGDGRRR